MKDAASSELSTELDVVIVNWNSRGLLADCVTSLTRSVKIRLDVVVVDNASSDGSAGSLLAGEVIRNETNRGFGAACNQGAAQGRAPFILFLNPDTRVAPDALRLALDHLAASPRIGVLGVRQTDTAGTTLRTCARAPSPSRLAGAAVGLDRLAPRLVRPHFMTEWDHQDTREVDQVMGAFLMIRRRLFEQLGGFDERFFVYFEDVDLCVRAAATGAKVVHFAPAVIWHATQGTTAQVKDRRLFYFVRSQALYVAKHHGVGAAIGLLLLDLCAQLPLRVARALVMGSRGDAAAVLRAAGLLLRDLPSLLRRLLGRSPGGFGGLRR